MQKAYRLFPLSTIDQRPEMPVARPWSTMYRAMTPRLEGREHWRSLVPAVHKSSLVTRDWDFEVASFGRNKPLGLAMIPTDWLGLPLIDASLHVR